jgi:hypothetical protein
MEGSSGWFRFPRRTLGNWAKVMFHRNMKQRKGIVFLGITILPEIPYKDTKNPLK